MSHLLERCILETRAGHKLLFSRSIHPYGMSAQVHDGANILAEMCFCYTGKRNQNFMVSTYAPLEGSTRPQLTKTYHGTKEAAHSKMERLAIRQFMERNEGRF